MSEVTVVVTVYNQANLVVRAIESAAAQSFRDLDIVIVDDASTDATPDVCQRLAAADARMRYFRLPVNSGVSAARNRGIDEARGRWIVFVDGDDRLVGDGIERLLSFPRIDEVQIVVGDFFRCEEGNRTSRVSLASDRTMFDVSDRSYLLKKLLERTTFTSTVWARLYNAAFLRERGIRFNTDLPRTQDAVFNMECLLRIDGLGIMHEEVYEYESYASSACHRVDPRQRERLERFRQASYDFLKRNGLEDDLHTSYVMLCAHLAFEIWTYAGERSSSNLQTICMTEPYRSLLPDISLEGLSFKERVKYGLLKHGCYRLLALRYRVKNSR